MALGRLPAILSFLWRATRGWRFRPWRAPYLRWRIETYWGSPADSIDRDGFLRFAFVERRRLWRFLVWAADMRRLARGVIRPAGSGYDEGLVRRRHCRRAA